MKLPQCLKINYTTVLLTFIFSILTFSLSSQTLWTGNSGTDWNIADNWSAGVPDAVTDAVIPDVTNKPIISVAGAVAKSVTVQANGLLTINAAGTLSINSSTTQAILNNGIVTNNGVITIGNVSSVGTYGIYNDGTFNNNANAQIKIDNVSNGGSSIFTLSGKLFNNYGSIIIGLNSFAGSYGVQNYGTFNNYVGGIVNIDRVNGTGFYASYFTNDGTINIGSVNQNTITINTGFLISRDSYNNATGVININRSVYGIRAFNNTFFNSGNVTVGELTPMNSLFHPQGSGFFSNNSGGVFKGSGDIEAAFFINTGGTLVPGYSAGTLTFNKATNLVNSTLAIEVYGTGTAGVNFDRLNVLGTATLGGILDVSINYIPNNGDQVTILSATVVNGTFTSVTNLPANWFVNYTANSVILSYGALPINTWTGAISSDWHLDGNWTDNVPDVADNVNIPLTITTPIINVAGAHAKSIKVQNGATLTITPAGTLSINGSITQGLWNQGAINNSGIINIGNMTSVGQFGIFNEGNFNNNSSGQINVDRATTAGIELVSNTFSNAGPIKIGALVPITNLILAETGTFNNNVGGTLFGTGNLSANNFTNSGGRLSPGYSPGKMTFTDSENFTNNILEIEVNGVGTPGTNFDQLVVSGTATLGGTLNVTINFSAIIGQQVTIVNASTISGTFAVINGLPPKWNVVYYPSSVVLVFGLPQTTWTGNSGTDWNTLGNWSLGIPDEASDVTIPDVTNKPIISVVGAVAKSVTIQNNSILTINAVGHLTINGAITQGFLNQGTLENNGIITIGNVSSVGTYGIKNEGIFNNNTNAQINIDNVLNGGSSIFNSPGTFNNSGILRIGANTFSGSYGVQNYGNFNNYAGGIVNIDRVNSTGFYASYFINDGTINIGSVNQNSTTINTGFLISRDSYNNASGEININRSVYGIRAFNNTFFNSGNVTVGELAPMSSLFHPQALGFFSNNSGGVFKGTGNVEAAFFINAGGTLVPGYSAGTLTFNTSTNLGNSTLAIEVNGTGTAGVNFDRLNVLGTATLGGILNVSINYTPANGNQIVILNASSVVGTFGSIIGLPLNWKISYTANTAVLSYDDKNTWTGNFDSNWNNIGNWSAGVIPHSLANVIIPVTANAPIINLVNAVAKTVHIQPGAVLTISVGADLTTHGFFLFNNKNSGIYIEGTLNNNGLLKLSQN